MARDMIGSETGEMTDTGISLGFTALAVTVALFGAWNAGRLHTGALTFVGMALFYGGLAQFMVGLWHLRREEAFGATMFTSFGAFWLGLGILYVFDTLGHLGAPMLGGDGITWLWFCWAIVSTYIWIASFRTNGAIVLTLLLWAAMFWALWLGALAGDKSGAGWTALGGYLGWATAIVAAYTAFAEILNRSLGRIVLPEFPTSRMEAAHR